MKMSELNKRLVEKMLPYADYLPHEKYAMAANFIGLMIIGAHISKLLAAQHVYAIPFVWIGIFGVVEKIRAFAAFQSVLRDFDYWLGRKLRDFNSNSGD